MTTYRVWCPEDGTEEADADSVDAICAVDAATDWVEAHHAELDYPKCVRVLVRGPVGILEFDVFAEQHVTFIARLPSEEIAS